MYCWRAKFCFFLFSILTKTFLLVNLHWVNKALWQMTTNSSPASRLNMVLRFVEDINDCNMDQLCSRLRCLTKFFISTSLSDVTMDLMIKLFTGTYAIHFQSPLFIIKSLSLSRKIKHNHRLQASENECTRLKLTPMSSNSRSAFHYI